MPSKSDSSKRADPSVVGATQFMEKFHAMISPQRLGSLINSRLDRKQRSDTKVSAPKLIAGMVFHRLQDGGKAAAHVSKIAGKKISDSAISQRLQRLGWEIIEMILNVILGGRADPKKHPQAFYRGLRLTGKGKFKIEIF